MRKLYRSTSCLFGAAIVLAMPLSCLAQAQASQEPTVRSAAAELGREDRTISATVVSVDQASRLVTLRGPKGKEVTLQAGPEVENFDQLKAGDQVTAHYQAALALQVMPADSTKAGVDVASHSTPAEQGSMPGLKKGDSITVTSKLTALDLKNHTLTLTGADGKSRVIEVKDPERQAKMSSLKVGDMVVVTYVEALAVKVTPKAKG
jgi:Cu/Ag efflux protein CusF